MKVAQNTVHRPQTAAGAQDTWTHGKCCPRDTEPQPFPLTPGIRRVSRLSMTKKKKLLYFCASQPAALSSEDFTQVFPSPPLCFVFFKDTLLSLPLLNSLAGLCQQLVLSMTVERGSRSEWSFYFLSRESVAYIMKRKQK